MPAEVEVEETQTDETKEEVRGADHDADAEALRRAEEKRAADAYEEKLRRKSAEIAKLHEKLKATEGIDLERYKALESEAKEREEARLRKEGEFEKLREKWNIERIEERKKLEAQLAERDARLKKYEVDDKVRAAALKNGVIPEDLEDVMRLLDGRFQRGDGDGIIVLDERGESTAYDLDRFFGEVYREAKPKFYKGTGATGSGAPSVTNTQRSSGPRGKVLGDFKTRKEKSDFIAKHGADAWEEVVRNTIGAA